MLELRNIDAGYNRRLVLKDVSVKIDTSAVTVIMGPNGAGKSTLLKVMYGLIRPVSGGIYLMTSKFGRSRRNWLKKAFL